MRALVAAKYRDYLSNSLTSFSRVGRDRVTISQITSAEIESYPWIIRFRVSTIFRESEISICGSTSMILLTASPMISIFLSTAFRVYKSF